MESIDIFTSLNKSLIIEASNDINEEIAGVYLKDGSPVFLINVADDRENNFTFAPLTWQYINARKNEIGGIFHTHHDEQQTPTLSWLDILLAHSIELPICVYHTKYKIWDFYNPEIPHPYPLRLHEKSALGAEWFTGWQYAPGRADCYSLVYYYYRLNFNIHLPIPTRTDADYGERAESWNRLFTESEMHGFTPRHGKPKSGDVIMMRLAASKHPNHLAVYCNDEYLLHNLGGKRKSELINIDSVRNAICGVYAHTNQI